MKNKLDIVFITDKNYIQHFTVALTSLLENNFNIINNVFLIHDIENISIFTQVKKFFISKYDKKIKLLKIDSQKLDKYNLSHHLTKATYFRLLIADVIPQEVNKILFLDSDIIVNGSIEKLTTLNFEKNETSDTQCYLFAADHRYLSSDLTRLQDLDFKGNKYFNAGILLINLKKWREDNTSKLFIQKLEKYGSKILWADQDILNLVFDEKWCELDYTYNAYGLLKHDKNIYNIIHYTGSSKPWYFFNNHPYKNLYWKYLKITPFKNYIPKDLTTINILKKIVPRTIKIFIKDVILKNLNKRTKK